MFKITPSIMTCDQLDYRTEIIKLVEAGIDHIHFDVMDGKFVPNLGLSPFVIEKIKKEFQITVDAHCMVNEIKNTLSMFKGADYITIHYGSSQSDGLEKTFELIRKAGSKPGLGIDLDDNFENYLSLLKKIKIVTIMSIRPGFTGQSFEEKTWDTINKIVKYRNENNLDFLIQIDGGVRDSNMQKLIDSGLDLIVVGSWLFGHDDYKKRLDTLK